MSGSVKSIRHLRNRYPQDELLERRVSQNPYRQFEKWMADALARIKEPHAMLLSTATPAGKPSARVVLLKGVTTGGFEFYTNYRSRKGREISVNPKAALTAYWFELGRQVRVEGRIRKISEAENDLYFASRPRESQVGAWASNQSRVLKNRKELLDRFAFFNRKFHGRPVPRPPWWGGYLLVAGHVEFWLSREGRLHDRILYKKTKGGGWRIVRLSP